MNTSLRISRKEMESDYFRFLYEALDFNDQRPYPAVLYVDKDKIFATDQKRIHIFNLDSYYQERYSLKPDQKGYDFVYFKGDPLEAIIMPMAKY